MKLIDTDFLQELQEILEGEFPVLIQTYIKDTTDRLKLFKIALQDSDAPSVYEITHSIKGASLNLGVTVLCELCLQVEKAAREGDLSVAERLAGDIQQAANATCQLLQDSYLS